MDKSNLDITLRAVVYHEDGCWLAHCLEMDIVADGKTAKQAVKDLVDLCIFQIRVALKENDFKSIFRSAPPEIWEKYAQASDGPSIRKPAKPVSRFEARELEYA